MADDAAIQANYASNANAYNQFLHTPLGTLEKQLLDLCIRELSGQRVLDLGGGTGLRAREALAAGATHVDVVDISTDMMREGQAHARAAGINDDAIRWFQGDASKSLAHLPLEPYDLVIANGIFDHAHDAAELEAMWRNSAQYLKPGGTVIANRNDPRSKCAVAMERGTGKYGVHFTDFKTFPGGTEFHYNMATQPPLRFESNALDVYAGGSLEIPGKFFEEFRNTPWQDTPVVKADPEFWADYLADPILYIFTAKKRAE